MTDAALEAPTEVVALTQPRDGVPHVTESASALADVVARFAAGTGPVAVDAERASGYRYSQRAYLVQLRRAGAGTALIDPIACPDLSELSAAIAGCEWVFHAASQDLACLREVGLSPTHVFDTELAARLLGYPRVGLASVVADTLGLGLAKEFSAADWSTRPLPANWLVYAALDVEVLVEVRDVLAAQLEEQGKMQWAQEEFAAVVDAPPPPARVDPWRRTSGIHTLHDARALAVVRSLWQARDELARQRDIAPGRLLPDAAIIQAATLQPTTWGGLMELRPFATSGRRRHSDAYLAAIRAAMQLPSTQLPRARRDTEPGLPPQRIWAHRFPDAARRLAQARVVLAAISQEHNVPAENLLPAAALREVCFHPPSPMSATRLADELRDLGARQWQATLVAPALAPALA